MKARMRCVALLLMLLFAAATAGAGTVTVEAVISPAWVEHAGGAREPLAPGQVLRDGDRVLTGSGARVLLRMAEGSAVKLGENAHLGVDRLTDNASAADRLVSGALDVAQGAFRFTTRFFGAQRARRDFSIRIVTVTAGIRGTDVWGKSSADRDVVCLIEGRIFVAHREQAFTMQDPLSFFIAARDGTRQPVAPVAPAQLQQWATETEIAPAGGATRRDGAHRVVLAAGVEEAAALDLGQRLRTDGYPARLRAYRAASGLRYEVHIAGLASAEDAKTLADALRRAGYTLPH
ncbi:MAG: FecR domain-containing protein [Betaproteobacteria bacterium]|nr:FecR domain-containing protein [Betaproteobacteria bacterium]MDH4292490.1 FecR domain-containing protein [Betaproteobacteria bacterium]MDH5341533.1 FecR domain-containing protein [Betaproteobacteria bacterium]